MSSTIKLTTFTSAGTEANKNFKHTTKPRDDYRVIFADRVRHPLVKEWVRNERGEIKKDEKGVKEFHMVQDTNRMLSAPRKIFSNEDEYIRWRRERMTFQEVEEVDIEEEEPEIEDLNSDLIKD